MSTTDRGYTLLLSHLHNPSTKLPLETIQGALAHHLSSLEPLPTPLAGTAISSPFYLSQPFTHLKIQSFATAFRHATHFKYRALVKAEKERSKMSMLLGRNMQSIMGQWVTDVLKGIYGGHPVLRVAACSGLLLGVEDLKVGDKDGSLDIGSWRYGVEDETVVALAEVMDTYAGSSQSSNGVEEWEKEFQPADILSLVLILASQSLPLVSEQKLKALPLAVLARLLTATISSTFKAGTFLSSVSASVTLSPTHRVHISPSSPLAQTLQSISTSPLTMSIPSLSRLTANILAILVDTASDEGLHSVSETLDILEDIAKQVERDWISCPLASFTDLDIASDSKEMTKSIWTTLKTLLFSNIMLAESILEASVYVPPTSLSDITPSSLALQTLHILSHLSFVISEFGGVTTTTQGFEHLKKTFYLALDILAQGDGESGVGDSGHKAEAYVQRICFSLNSQRAETATSPRQAKQAFALASIEQLVPVLSDKCIRDWVWGVCYPHLTDSTHRETYESAHSVVLSIFASYAQRQQQNVPLNVSSDRTSASLSKKKKAKHIPNLQHGFAAKLYSTVIGSEKKEANIQSQDESSLSATFIQRMIPFYASCLIDNSVDGKLSTPQLQLAYSALVRSASVSAFTSTGAPDDTFTLAWYCIQLILDTIHELSPAAPEPVNPKGKGKEIQSMDNNNTDRIHRLHLMLISTVSSLPLPLMVRALDEIRVFISAYPRNGSGDGKEQTEKTKKEELVHALFHELLEKTGDREKEAAIRWWYKYREVLVQGKEGRLSGSFPSSSDQKDDAGAKGTAREHHSSAEQGQLGQSMLSRL
ncbi:hypothetical protein CPC08DRAFT_635895 [Agrocybe pediades]|nr:hypothetical protein CPC08DRAFT_635895 [Agrocybe pediades]